MPTFALLSHGEINAKTRKHFIDLGIEPAILHLAPSMVSGFQTCPAADDCASVCIYTAGHGFRRNVQDARIRKTRQLFTDRDHFLATLVTDIETHAANAARNERTPAARLNGTSDIQWERFPVIRAGVHHPHIFAAFPEVRFYDYTKIFARIRATREIPNYHLTFSLSASNDRMATKALAAGVNVAAVIRDAGAEWSGYPVIDGDAHDFRFMDPSGPVIVALSPKGAAKRDVSGFVRDAAASLDPTRTPRFATQGA